VGKKATTQSGTSRLIQFSFHFYSLVNRSTRKPLLALIFSWAHCSMESAVLAP
jgi:hypothetical protein